MRLTDAPNTDALGCGIRLGGIILFSLGLHDDPLKKALAYKTESLKGRNRNTVLTPISPQTSSHKTRPYKRTRLASTACLIVFYHDYRTVLLYYLLVPEKK